MTEPRSWTPARPALLDRVLAPCRAFVSHPGFLHAFSFGIVGLTFRQGRFDFGFGAAEIVLAALLVVVFASERWRAARAQRMILVATALFLCLSAGTAWALVVEPGRISTRDLLAYPFTFAIVCAFVTAAVDRERAAFRALGEVIGLSLLVLLIAGVTPSPIQRLMWYFDNEDHLRLQGLSDNPNQIAFLATVGLGLLSLPLWKGTAGSGLRLMAALGCAGAGMWSRSRAFTVTLAIILALVIVQFVARRLSDGGRPTPIEPWGLALLAAVALATPDAALRRLSSVEPPQRLWLQPPYLEFFREMMARKGVPEGAGPATGDFRLGLWRGALQTFARSPLIGLGMGAHIPPPKEMSRPAFFGPVPPQEAHNTLLDLLVVSGLVGVVPLIALLGRILSSAWASGLGPALVLVGGPTAAFSMVHFVGRQPALWIVVLACACLPSLLRSGQAVE